MTFANKINWGSIFAILVLVNIAYFPTIVVSRSAYATVNLAIAFCIGAFLFTSFKSIWNTFSKYLILLTLIFLFASFVVILLYGKDYFPHSFNLYISLICFALGYLVYDNSLFKIKLAMAIYSIAACVMGIYSVFLNIGSFTITQQYAILFKNSSGVIVASGTLLSLTLALDSTNVRNRTFWIVIALLNFASLLVFRARSALLGLLFVFAIIILKNVLFEDSRYRTRILLLLGLLMALCLLDLIPLDMVYDSMFANKKTDDINDLSSGRIGMFRIAMEYFNQNPIGGALASNVQPRSIDNYVMNQLGRYGLIGVLTNIPPYLYIWGITIRGIIRNSGFWVIPYYLLFILCFVSFTEGAFPFGPGTPCVCAYVMLGLCLNYIKTHEIDT